MRTPEIELLWWEGCPSTEQALAQLRALLGELGLDGLDVRTTEIHTEAEARASGFVGSPTILIDGQDVSSPDPQDPPGLACRVYRRRDGRVSPLPDPNDVRDALRRALAEQETNR
jgi:hypothetical protein